VQGEALRNERCKKRAMRKALVRTSMETHLGQQKRPDVSTEQRKSSELVKRIRKLRWMGLEAEAERVEMALCRGPAGDSVLAAPHETD
jgi:hypothetical protein